MLLVSLRVHECNSYSTPKLGVPAPDSIGQCRLVRLYQLCCFPFCHLSLMSSRVPNLPTVQHESSLYTEAAACAGAPIVQLRNGSLCGTERSVSGQAQVAFLGIPFAQPPIGDFRFRHPVPYNGTYQERDATSQTHSFPGYRGFSANIGPLSEDCLYLNIIRLKEQTHKSVSMDRTTHAPHQDTPHTEDKLPVLVWIYGGGFTASGITDPRFDMSYIMAQAEKIGKPIIAVSLTIKPL